MHSIGHCPVWSPGRALARAVSSVGAHADRVVFDYFGAFTQVPGHYTVPLAAALDAAGGHVDAVGADDRAPAFAGRSHRPFLPLALD